MGSIALLPEVLRSRIAAGEVIERPASVVKELCENALDAGASRIDVQVAGGGTEQIRIADDGRGISRDELPLAVVRHATSKLRAIEDLDHLGTLGFRGEALASIGAVAELTLTSRRPDAVEGWRLDVSGGDVSDVRVAGCAVGTTVEVRRLFAHVPARRKFLKSASAETAAVADVVTRLALGHPGVGFALHSGKRTLVDAPPAADLRARAAQIFGAALASRCLDVEAGQRGWLYVRGLVAPPSETRATSKQLYISIMGRPVVDKMVQAAVQEAFRGHLMVRRYPIGVLDLEVAPGEVDVNVHPGKHEVRFRSHRAVFSLVSQAVREALGTARLGVEVRSDGPAAPAGAPEGGAAGVASSPSNPHPTRAGVVAEAAFDLWQGARRREAREGADAAVALAERGGAAAEADPAPPQAPEAPGDSLLGAYRLLGQFAQTYIVVETDAGLRVFDQHALHERILFDQLMRRQGPAEAQRLLVPEVIELSPDEAAALEQGGEVLAELGFCLADFGGRSVAITAVPAMLSLAAAPKFLRDVLGEMTEDGRGEQAVAALQHKLRARLACRAAVKAHQRLRHEEMEGLLAAFAGDNPPHHCPHGRPTSLLLNEAEIERRFGRQGAI